MKKIAFLLCAVLLTGCGAEVPAVPAEPVPQEPTEMPAESEASVSAEADWRNAYKSFLTDLCQRETAVRNIERPDYDPDTYGSELSALSSGYCLYDIDKDGVPEMFVRYGSGEADYLTRVYTCLEGVVAQAGEFPSGHASLYT